MKKSKTDSYQYWTLICESMDPIELINNSYSVKEVAVIFKKTDRTVYSWIYDKILFSFQPTKEHFIPKAYITEMLKPSKV